MTLHSVKLLRDIIMALLKEDCLALMPNIPDKSIDMILCDLPYGTTACEWDIKS
jgi:site-specific DNA-methyltransferase (adenine-specific)/modification methylase